MCDFLLLNKENWMDSLTSIQLAEMEKKYPKTWRQKYNSRNGRGDFIECKPDGFYKDHQHGGGQFIILHVPGLSVEEGMKISCPSWIDGPIIDTEGNPVRVLQYKNKHRLKFSNLPANIKNKMNKDYVHTLTKVDFAKFKADYIESREEDMA
jgi:hypothetical protein